MQFTVSKIVLFSLFVACISVLPARAADRLGQVLETKELRVCIWPGYFSITYQNPRTQLLEGIDIDMAKALAKHLGVGLKFVDSSFARLINNMTTDACDVAMHGVGIRESRKAYMDFTQPHLVSGIYAVVDKQNSDIREWADIDQPGVVVVVQKSTYMEPVMRDYLKHAELSVVNSFKAREQEVQSGRADVFMTDYPYGKRMVSLTEWASLLAPSEPLAPTPYAYAVPKGDKQWLKTVDEFVSLVKADGRLKAAAVKHGLSPIVAD
ncbi:MAG: substrate-binding periplasmic protein [Pontibacterium sp.]